MNVKAVVKVMNFHALLRVENARKEADKYTMLEEELSRMMGLIINNRNLLTDGKIMRPKRGGKELTVYIGSDFGFCGSVNSSVMAKESQERSEEQVVIGKKIRRIQKKTLQFTREELGLRWDEIQTLLTRAVREEKYGAIYLVYNHYHNMSSIECVKRRIYPIDTNDMALAESGDFLIHGEARTILQNMMITYLSFETRMAAVSAFASENISRRNATTESLKKIDEMEQEELWNVRKERSQKAFRKVIDSFVKKKSYGGTG